MKSYSFPGFCVCSQDCGDTARVLAMQDTPPPMSESWSRNIYPGLNTRSILLGDAGRRRKDVSRKGKSGNLQ